MRCQPLLAGIVVVLVLAGCGSFGRSAPVRAVVDFGPPAAPFDSRRSAPNFGLEVRAPAWVDATGISYRLAYADRHQRNSYAETQWAGAPTQLIAQRLRQRLNLGQAVAGRCVLRISIDEFSQVFAMPAASHAVLRGEALLVDPRGRVAGRLPLQAETPAASADARGGVTALVAAVDTVARELAIWLAAGPAAPGGGACAE